MKQIIMRMIQEGQKSEVLSSTVYNWYYLCMYSFKCVTFCSFSAVLLTLLFSLVVAVITELIETKTLIFCIFFINKKSVLKNKESIRVFVKMLALNPDVGMKRLNTHTQPKSSLDDINDSN